MTAPQPATPGSDSPTPGTETCAPDCAERTACPVVGELGHWQCGTCPKHKEPRHHCGCPVAPSPFTPHPPAETQQDGGLCDDRGPRIGSEGTPRCRRPLGHDGPHRPAEEDGWGMAMSWGNLPTADTPAETQQDDERERFIAGLAPELEQWLHAHSDDTRTELLASALAGWLAERRETRAARPSADTEKVVRRILNTVDPLGSGVEVRQQCIAVVRAALDAR